jgi:ferredoxin
MPRVVIDPDRCLCAGVCVNYAPDVFDLDEQGQAFVIVSGDINSSSLDSVQDSIDACPNDAIAWESSR